MFALAAGCATAVILYVWMFTHWYQCARVLEWVGIKPFNLIITLGDRICGHTEQEQEGKISQQKAPSLWLILLIGTPVGLWMAICATVMICLPIGAGCLVAWIIRWSI